MNPSAEVGSSALHVAAATFSVAVGSGSAATFQSSAAQLCLSANINITSLINQLIEILPGESIS